MRPINLRGGREVFGNTLDCVDESVPLSQRRFHQDVACWAWDNCHIDVGQYRDRELTIMVIQAENGSASVEAWGSPLATISCQTWDDFYGQLQRAIDIYASGQSND